MKNFMVLLLLGLICLSAGCSKYYYQEGKSFEECAKDRIDCFSEMKKRMSTSETPGSYEYKFIEDCMTGIVYKDDSQIYYLQARKKYGENPRIEVTIETKEKLKIRD